MIRDYECTHVCCKNHSVFIHKTSLKEPNVKSVIDNVLGDLTHLLYHCCYYDDDDDDAAAADDDDENENDDDDHRQRSRAALL